MSENKKTLDEKREIVVAIDLKIAHGKTAVDAAKCHLVSVTDYMAWKTVIRQFGKENSLAVIPKFTDSPGAEESNYEDVHAMYDTLLDGSGLETQAEAVQKLIDVHVPKIQELLDSEFSSARVAGGIIDRILSDIQAVLDLTADEESETDGAEK